jgi:hypothetical protein
MSDANFYTSTGLPQAEYDILEQLQNAGLLESATPDDLAVIFQAEGGNTTDAVNSEGYGGWFGTTDGTAPFATQAESAASTYTAGLEASGGNPVGAEEYYQTGSTTGGGSGAGVFQQYIDAGDIPGTEEVTATPASSRTASGGVAVGKKGQYDWFTNAMIQLNDAMHPHTNATTALLTLGVSAAGSDAEMILARGSFALAFGALGFLALFKSGKAGGLSPLDITGLVAGFVAGPEIGAVNALSKLGIKKPSKAGASAYDASNPIVQQRTALAGQRVNIAQQKENRLGQGSLKPVNEPVLA